MDIDSDKEYSDSFKTKMKLALTKRYEEIGLEVTDDALLNKLMDMVIYQDIKTLQEFKVTIDDVKKSFDLKRDKDFNFRNKSNIGNVYNELKEEPENDKRKERFLILLNEAIFELNISLLEDNDKLNDNSFLNRNKLSELQEELNILVKDKDNYDSEYFEVIIEALQNDIELHEVEFSEINQSKIKNYSLLETLNKVKEGLSLEYTKKHVIPNIPKYKHRS